MMKEPKTREEAEAFIRAMKPFTGGEPIYECCDSIRILANSLMIIAKDDLKQREEGRNDT